MRQRWTWLIFAVCLAVVLTAMGWTTRTVVRLDRAQAEARQRAEFEQTVRLAMWRMESALSPLIAQESSYPSFAYQAFTAINAAPVPGARESLGGEVLIPSALMAQANPQVVMHFQLDVDGSLTSPQVPVGAMRKLAENQGYLSRQTIEEASKRLAALNRIIRRDPLQALLPAPQLPQPMVMAAPSPSPAQPPPEQVVPFTVQMEQQGEQQAEGRIAQDNQARAAQQQRLQNVAQNISFSNAFISPVNLQGENGNLNIDMGLMQPVWVEELLLLARRVSRSGREVIQGSQLDWAVIRRTLLADIADLLPAATLEPVAAPATATRSLERDDLQLAALPVRLVPGAAAVGPAVLTPSLKYSLMTAWAGVLLATVAAAVLLRGLLALSERRAAFVSAVTHELRTPLTTFKLYTEMLEQGRVTGEDRRRQYLGTLRSQADRLSHLVENVLAYARLERVRKRPPLEDVLLADLVSQLRDRIAEQTAHTGMEVRFRVDECSRHASTPPLPVHLRIHRAAVEQILMNLVDNACKYAASAEDRTIDITASVDQDAGWIRVHDHGPGIPASERHMLFRPFHKSAHQAADSAPGVGLGLSLSRRLAREMGGDLWLDTGVTEGACFVLRLRTA